MKNWDKTSKGFDEAMKKIWLESEAKLINELHNNMKNKVSTNSNIDKLNDLIEESKKISGLIDVSISNKTDSNPLQILKSRSFGTTLTSKLTNQEFLEKLMGSMDIIETSVVPDIIIKEDGVIKDSNGNKMIITKTSE